MNHRILLFSALALTGCGGAAGPGGGGPPVSVTVVIPSTTARNAWITSEGLVLIGFMVVGDFETGTGSVSLRGVVGFDLASAGIPPGATIQTATLALQQGPGLGDAYAGLGNLLVDHVELGAGIDLSDHSSGALLAGFGVLSTDAAMVVKSLEVGARVQADLTAGRTFSDFRLRFAANFNVDGTDDYAQFNDTDNSLGVGPAPSLTVTYVP